MCNNRVRLTLAGAIALLVGCDVHGPSVGSSGKESASASTASDAGDRRERAVSVSGTSRVSVPAFAIIAQGLMSEYDTSFDLSHAMIDEAALTDPGNGDVCKGFEAWPDYQATIKVAKGTGSEAAAAVATLHHIYRVPILWVLRSAAGWQVDTFDHSEKGRLATARYITALMQSTIYANDVFSELAEAVGQEALSNPEAAEKRVWAAYKAIPWENLSTACRRAHGLALKAGQRTIGNGNFWFTTAGLGAFEFDAGGAKWKQWGMTWFGEGRISGVSRELTLASASTLTQTQTASESFQFKTENATAASADVKAGK